MTQGGGFAGNKKGPRPLPGTRAGQFQGTKKLSSQRKRDESQDTPAVPPLLSHLWPVTAHGCFAAWEPPIPSYLRAVVLSSADHSVARSPQQTVRACTNPRVAGIFAAVTLPHHRGQLCGITPLFSSKGLYHTLRALVKGFAEI